MGANQTSSELPIDPQPLPIYATDSRFCFPHNIQLNVTKNFRLETYDITDTNNHFVFYFNCERSIFSIKEKQILRDNEGVPVLNMKHKLCSSVHTYKIFAGEGSEQLICKIKSVQGFRPKTTAILFDLNRQIMQHLVLKGDGVKKPCVIYLGEGPKKGGKLIARIVRPNERPCFANGNNYVVEIAAGIDIAICVILCITLERHSRTNGMVFMP